MSNFRSFPRAPADNIGMSTANLPNTAALTTAMTSAVRPGILSRIAAWFSKAPGLARGFRRGVPESAGPASTSDLPTVTTTALYGGNQPETLEPRGGFLGFKSRRDSAVETLENGLGLLAELMTGIRDSLEAQSRRQDELVRCLSNLPEVMQQLPVSNRLQLETLGALRQQMERQSSQQGQLADVLERISQADLDQGRALDALCGHEAAISENLSRVSTAMQSVGANSEAAARVLQQLHDSIDNRDGELQRAVKTQNARLNIFLTAAVSLSVAALGSIAVLGFLMIHRGH